MTVASWWNNRIQTWWNNRMYANVLLNNILLNKNHRAWCRWIAVDMFMKNAIELYLLERKLLAGTLRSNSQLRKYSTTDSNAISGTLCAALLLLLVNFCCYNCCFSKNNILTYGLNHCITRFHIANSERM